MNYIEYRQPIYFAMAVLCLACRGDVYVTKEFAFPENIPAHEVGWKYRGTVKTSSPGPWARKNVKKVDIFIWDRSEEKVVLEHLNFMASALRANITWREEKNLIIEIYEEGNSSENSDNYNTTLLKNGPILLCRLEYNPVSVLARKMELLPKSECPSHT
jgi:hypothetical protein